VVQVGEDKEAMLKHQQLKYKQKQDRKQAAEAKAAKDEHEKTNQPKQ